VHYIIVDEGPGQSGSSFAAVAECLKARGVAPDRIAVMPSHGGPPGASAPEERRRWWRQTQRETGDFGERWPELIGRWVETSIGPLNDPPRDMSVGIWRSLRHPLKRDWPAAVPAWERRKYLVSASGEQFLVKFAGLGAVGEEKLKIARVLHSEGFVPEALGTVHGFLVERWCGDASPLAANERPVGEIARYLGTRAKLLPARTDSGASIDALLVMIRRNVSLELGDAYTSTLNAWKERTADLQRQVVRVRTDNKLDRHEWLRSASGALIKTDALDHHCAHDLVGCQDLAWDCAGAIVEFDMDQNERRQFVAAAEYWAGRAIDLDLLHFCRIAYLAFRLGQARFGETTVSDSSELRRLRIQGDRYAVELQHLLESTGTATRHESSVG
jgi:hypothetical protein